MPIDNGREGNVWQAGEAAEETEMKNGIISPDSPVCCKPPEDKASIQGSFCKPSSLQIRQQLKLRCITIQADVSMADE